MDELEATESVINEWKEERERNEATIKKAKEDEEIIRKKLKDTSKELETLNTCMVFQSEHICEEGMNIKKLEEKMDEHRIFVKEFVETTGGQRNDDMSENHRKLLKTSSLYHVEEIKRNTSELLYMRRIKKEYEEERAETKRDYEEKKKEENDLKRKLKDHETSIEILIEIDAMIKREIYRNINERERLSGIH